MDRINYLAAEVGNNRRVQTAHGSQHCSQINMKTIPLRVRVRGFFARDKYQFWWNYFSDEELALRKMSVFDLAGLIEEAGHTGMVKKKIVAEHLLNLRLAQLQARASWGSAFVGLLGVILGSVLTYLLK